MTALLTARPGIRVAAARQESLFGDGEQLEAPAAPATAAAPAPPELEPPAAPAPTPAAPPQARTLDAAMTSLWDRLTAGRSVTCPVCDAPMEPRHSAAAGVVGGRCRSCGSTLA
jgi:hypothetical protein